MNLPSLRHAKKILETHERHLLDAELKKWRGQDMVFDRPLSYEEFFFALEHAKSVEVRCQMRK